MILKNVPFSLYSKIALWLVLNLVLLVVLGVGIGWYVLLGNGNGLVPAHLFSSNIENSFRLISVNLQYRSVFTWQKLLKQYDRGDALRFHLRSLETGVLYDDCIPDEVIRAAKGIPKSTFTLCPDPDVPLWDSLRGGFFDTQQKNMEAGLPPIPPAIFLRTESPTRYWYGRILYIPDKNQQLHYVLLALETDSFYGYGLFFEFKGVLLVILAVLGVSCLWWWPFVRHLSRPLLKMVHYAEQVEMDNFVCLDKALSESKTFSGERRDEIGRLGHAFMSMTRRVGMLISGQSQFIRHIAHELNSPLARTQIGLAVLEERLEGKPRERVRRIMKDIDRLSVLTDEVLSYLQAKASLGTPKQERVYLCPFLSSLVRREAPDADVHVFADKDAWVWVDKDYLRRIVINLLRNAVAYAGDAGPVVVSVREEPGEVCITIRDKGPGVPEQDLPLLLEPFYRGKASLTHPGGSGLGLSIVKYCMEACGGRIEYGNAEPSGFQVALFFPKGKGSSLG